MGSSYLGGAAATHLAARCAPGWRFRLGLWREVLEGRFAIRKETCLKL